MDLCCLHVSPHFLIMNRSDLTSFIFTFPFTFAYMHWCFLICTSSICALILQIVSRNYCKIIGLLFYVLCMYLLCISSFFYILVMISFRLNFSFLLPFLYDLAGMLSLPGVSPTFDSVGVCNYSSSTLTFPSLSLLLGFSFEFSCTSSFNSSLLMLHSWFADFPMS